MDLQTHLAPVSESAAPSYLLWESPDPSAAVQINAALVVSLNQALAKLEADPPVRGAELGGLLLGRMETSPRLTIWVESFEPSSLDPKAGPSWRPAPLVTGALISRAASDTNPKVVGIFRSHTRKDLFLDDDDKRLRQLVFPGRAGVFLIAKPFYTKETEAGIQLWEKSGEVLNQELGRLPLGRMPAIAPALPKPEAIPEIAEFEKERSRRRVWPYALAAGLLLLLGGFAYWKSPAVIQRAKAVENSFRPPVDYKPGGPAVQPPPKMDPAVFAMGLEAHFRPDQIAIQWNPAASVLQGAAHGRLLIVEGEHQQEYVLGAAQFQLGTYACPREPLTPDLTPPPTTVRLEVAIDPRHLVSEETAVTRSLLADMQLSGSEAAPPTPVAPPPAEEAKPKPEKPAGKRRAKAAKKAPELL